MLLLLLLLLDDHLCEGYTLAMNSMTINNIYLMKRKRHIKPIYTFIEYLDRQI